MVVVDSLLIIILAICVFTDLKSRKIYNAVTLPGTVIGFMLLSASDGFPGFVDGVLGFVVGFGILLIPYLLGGMGAGDVKLLGLVGAFKGVTFVLLASVYMALIGGVIALALLLLRKGVIERLKQVIFSVVLLRYGMKISSAMKDDAFTAAFPYGVAIAGGAVLSLWLRGWGIL
ncbi:MULTISPECIES: prepilin peptidase [unclassified Paenibacillus]|uniref:A24 family peptidase n=1 Tax=unclassified Paenibacillus TaxID=185978 RepID=UPI0027825F9D|nr:MULTISPECIES: A24 family peptidase [unclassified Paenibacillus]MDQ0902281.1 prepilin peptidase CpaA [Paenibacillus sp. V4I7]MDQ0919223.1 prepilin peptidase CpaA [Paenibacillus sp. V4I5]